MISQRPLHLTLGAAILILIVYVTTSCFDGSFTLPSQQQWDRRTTKSTQKPLSDSETALDNSTSSVKQHVQNATFGFEKIFAIGLAERSDRRDKLSLVASYQDIKIDWVEAVKGEDMSKKAWPLGWDTQWRKTPELGCWRSHANVLRRIVEEKISSALILEDDADWDISFKDQLVSFAKITRNLDNHLRLTGDPLNDTTPTRTPYGDDWDILWLGTLNTAPVPEGAQSFLGKGEHDHSVWNETRGGIAGTAGYAVTYQSARLLLGYLQGSSLPVDLAMSEFCYSRRCVVTWPPLIGVHRPAGSTAKDSDIGVSHSEEETRQRGYTWDVVDSSRLDAVDRSTSGVYIS